MDYAVLVKIDAYALITPISSTIIMDPYLLFTTHNYGTFE